MNDYKLRYPLGEFAKPEIIDSKIIADWICTIANFPTNIENEVSGLSDEELLYKYRPNGWNIRQLVHHCADSHINSLIRFKLTLTEEKPTIKPYFEDRWAELADTKNTPINLSLKILEGLHARWTVLLNSLTEQQLARTFIHPEYGKVISLRENIGIYSWHCNHHLEHIRIAKLNKLK